MISLEFKNELGNKIIMKFSKKNDLLTYKIIGPNSEIENTITMIEAKNLKLILDKIIK